MIKLIYLLYHPQLYSGSAIFDFMMYLHYTITWYILIIVSILIFLLLFNLKQIINIIYKLAYFMFYILQFLFFVILYLIQERNNIGEAFSHLQKYKNDLLHSFKINQRKRNYGWFSILNYCLNSSLNSPKICINLPKFCQNKNLLFILELIFIISSVIFFSLFILYFSYVLEDKTPPAAVSAMTLYVYHSISNFLLPENIAPIVQGFPKYRSLSTLNAFNSPLTYCPDILIAHEAARALEFAKFLQLYDIDLAHMRGVISESTVETLKNLVSSNVDVTNELKAAYRAHYNVNPTGAALATPLINNASNLQEILANRRAASVSLLAPLTSITKALSVISTSFGSPVDSAQEAFACVCNSTLPKVVDAFYSSPHNGPKVLITLAPVFEVNISHNYASRFVDGIAQDSMVVVAETVCGEMSSSFYSIIFSPTVVNVEIAAPNHSLISAYYQFLSDEVSQGLSNSYHVSLPDTIQVTCRPVIESADYTEIDSIIQNSVREKLEPIMSQYPLDQRPKVGIILAPIVVPTSS